VLAAGGGFDPIHFDPAAFMLTLITFLGLLFILTKFAWKPVLTGIEARENRIEQAIAQAETDREQAARALAEYQESIKGVQAEVAALREKGKAEAEALRGEILARADAEAEASKDRALREIELARTQALEDIRKESVAVGMAVASKIVGRSLDGDDHRRLADEVVSGLGGVGS